MNEKEILNRIFPILIQGEDIIVGPGDDCAAVDVGDPKYCFLLATDQIISGVHYDPSDTTPQKAGAKLIKRNISDIAAMGGKPLHALVTLALSNQNSTWIESFYKGLSTEANKWNMSICGGDIALLKNGSNSAVTTLSITGKVEKNKICLRKNAKPGELLFATGTFGDSYKTRHHLNFTPRVKEAAFLADKYTTAMMDISDGLLIDIQRMAEASSITIKLNLDAIPSRTPSLPIEHILSDGEDYELIFTVKPSLEKELLEKWPFPEVKLTKIGEILPSQNSNVIDQNGTDLIKKIAKTGYDHFNKNLN